MSRQSKNNAKRVFAALLAGLIVSGMTPAGSVGGETFSLTASADSTAVTLSGDETTGYYVNMSQSDSQTLDLSDKADGFSFNVYDDGGKGGNYSNNCNGSLTITAPDGFLVVLEGSILAEHIGCDYLEVYDGEGTDSTSLGRFGCQSSHVLTNIEKTYCANQMRLLFHSDGSVVNSGLDLKVTLVKAQDYNISVGETMNGSLTVDKETEKVCETVTVSATPKEGYVLKSVTVKDKDGQEVAVNGGTWYTEDKATFKVPFSDVTVTAEFVKEKYRSVYIPESGDFVVNIPEGVETFKVYNTNNADNSTRSVTLQSPSGTKMQTYGSVKFGNNYGDAVYVVDASGTLYRQNAYENQVNENVGPFLTANNQLTFAYSQYQDFDNDVEFTVNVISSEKTFEVKTAETENGTITSDKTLAKVGETVKLTAAPAEGYQLADVLVYDEDGNPVDVTGGKWYNSSTDEISFSMPVSDAMVTAVFVSEAEATAESGLYVDLPENPDSYPFVSSSVTVPSYVKSFKVYDDGGKDGNYSTFYNGQLNLTAPDGYVFCVTGSVTTGDENDSVFLYSSGKKLGEFRSSSNGVKTEITKTFSVGTNLTVGLSAGGYNTDAGLDLTVTLVKADSETPHTITIAGVEGGTLAAPEPSTAVTGEPVTLEAIPEDGFILVGAEVTDSNGSAVSVTGAEWYSGGRVNFSMPDDNVTVTPIFSNKVTAEDGLFINMPSSSLNGFMNPSLDVTLPKNLKSFKLYDDGGKDGRYSNHYNGNVNVTAPEGYVMQISGSITTDGYNSSSNSDFLSISNLNASNREFRSALAGEETAINPYYTYGNYTRFSFYSNEIRNYDGFDVTVRLFKADQNTITIAETSGGTVTANQEKASVGTNVTITLTPNDGHIVKSLNVTDENGNEIETTHQPWATSASFVMPETAVTVSAEFTDDPASTNGVSFNLPYSGSRSIYVPEGVTTFNVYDDGGKDGNYTYGCDGSLYFYPPEGYGIEVSGTLKAPANSVELKLYDEDQYVEYNGNGATQTVPTFMSTDDYTGIYFETYSSSSGSSYQTDEGVDLTVNLFKLNEAHTITVDSEITNGTVTADKESANPGETVTLTITSDEGYYLKSLTVKDKNGAVLDTDIYVLSSGSASFKMPASDVSVTAEFTDDIDQTNNELRIPHSGNVEWVIPSNVTSFKVYDDGGKDRNYSNYCSGKLTLTAPEGKRLAVVGSVWVESGWDYLNIYDGDADSSASLAERIGYYDAYEETGLIISSENRMTLEFYSDSSSTYPGVDLTVTVIDADAAVTERNITISNPTEGGEVTASAEKAMPGTTITLTAEPDEGYLLTDVTATDSNGSPVTITNSKWYQDGTITFRMPFTDVTVTPVFSNDLTAEGGLYIDLPYDSQLGVTIPNAVKSFKVYDDGGKDGNYTAHCYGSVEFYSPEGTLMEVSGSLTTDGSNNVYLDYDYISADQDTYYGSAPGVKTELPTLYSYRNELDIEFNSYYGSNTTYEGLDLKVSIIDPNKQNSITVNNPENGGTVSTNKSSAAFSEKITCTITSDDGYLLTELIVLDEKGNELSVTGGKWYNQNRKTATFSMPASAVTVTPVFTNDLTAEGGLYVDFPNDNSNVVRGIGNNQFSAQVYVPAAVQSFKIYDNGGKDGNYSNDYSGYLTVYTASRSGAEISGSLTADSKDMLSITTISTYTNPYVFSGSSDSSETTVGPITFNDSMVGFEFETNSSGSYAGLDLTYTILPGDQTVTLNLEGGALAENESETIPFTSQSEDFTLPKPKKHANFFAGWLDPRTGTNLGKDVVIKKGTTGDKFFDAEWEETTYRTFELSENMEFISATTDPLIVDGDTYYDKGTVIKFKAPNGYKAKGDVSDGTNKLTADKNGVYTVTMGEPDVIVTADIVPIEYTITYNGVDGAKNDNVKSYNIESDDIKLSDPTKTGYTFTGWTYDGQNKPTKNVTIAKGSIGNKTFTANWKINQYTVTFDTNGGSKINPITQDYGTAIKAPADPTRTGYTFTGWDKEIPTTMPAKNIIVKAQWKINQYTVTFDTNGGSKINPITQDYGTAVTAPADPTRTGYTFTGWDKAVPETMPAENVTIKAQWKINQYTVTFETNGGSKISSITQDYNSKIKAPSDPTKEGFSFAGWYKDSEFKTKWNFDSDTLTADITLYAKWTESSSDTEKVDTTTDTESDSDTEKVDTTSDTESDSDTEKVDTTTDTESDSDTEKVDTTTDTESDSDTEKVDTTSDTESDSDTEKVDTTTDTESDSDTEKVDTTTDTESDSDTTDTDTESDSDTTDTDTESDSDTTDTDTDTDTEPDFMLGDLDEDGEITANDAIMALRYSIGIDEYDEKILAIGDVDGDGEITANDAIMILRASIDLETLGE